MTGLPITGMNAAFLHLETPSAPLNIVGILWIDDTRGPAFTRDEFAGRLAALVDQAPPLRQRPERTRRGRGFVWADCSLDLDHHVQRIVAPPGSGPEFVVGIATERAGHHLPRDRPLWLHTVVEGVAGPDGATAALVTCTHHARNDGLGALAALAVLAGAPVPVQPEAAPSSPGRRLARAARATIAPLRVARRVRRRRKAGQRVPRGPRDTPRLTVSRAITAERVLATVEVPVADLLEVRRAFGVTFNDVYLALVAGAVRAWLGPDCPDVPAVAIVPLSTRAGNDAPTNQFTAYVTGLPVHLAEPAARVRDVAAEMTAVKEFHADADAVGLDLATVPWSLVGRWFTRYSERGRADTGRLAANLLATSIAGPREILDLGGYRLVGMTAFGPITDGITVNVTGVSYGDRVRIGIAGAAVVEPGVASLAESFTGEAARLLAAARSIGGSADDGPS